MTERSTWQRLCPLQDWRDSVLDAIEAHLAEPQTRAELNDCDVAASYPRSVIERLRRLGLALLFAEDERASARDSRVSVYHLTALSAMAARENASLAVTLGINGLALLPAYIAGTDEQLRVIFRRVHDGSFAALLLTELSHGSNLLRNETCGEPGTMAHGIFAATDGGTPPTHFRINGEKNLINGATEHDLRFVLARTWPAGDQSLPAAGFTVLMVDRPDGVEPLARWKTLPLAAADISGARFHDVVVPVGNAIGREGDGFALVQRALAISRGGISAFAAGTSCRGYELALDYASSRDIYGEPILRLGAIADHLIRFEALDLLVAAMSLKATAMMNALGPAAVHYTAAAKLIACALAEEGVAEGKRVLAARSLLRALPYESVMRDVMVYGIFDGTSHLMLDQLQRQLTKLAGRAAPTGEEDCLNSVRRIYATAPTRIIESSRYRARPHVAPVDQAARALAHLSGRVQLDGVIVAAEALLVVVRGLREQGVWDGDQGARFAGGEILAGLEAILALIELADPDRRSALGLIVNTDSGARAERQPLIYRYALGWYGARLCGQLRQLAIVGGLDAPSSLDEAQRCLTREAAQARTLLTEKLQGTAHERPRS